MNIFFCTYNLHRSLTELQPSLSSVCIKLSHKHFPTKNHFPGKKRGKKKKATVITLKEKQIKAIWDNRFLTS